MEPEKNLRDRILAYFEGKDKAVDIDTVAYDLGVEGVKPLSKFFSIMKELCAEHRLEKVKDGYRPYSKDVYEGYFKAMRESHGYFIPDNEQLSDLMIKKDNQKGAMSGDRVLVTLGGIDKRTKRQEGIIVSILERSTTQVVGRLDRRVGYGFVIPDKENLCPDIFVGDKNLAYAEDGMKVLVAITKYPDGRRNPEGKVIQILGYPGETGVDVSCIMAENDIDFKFSLEVLSQAEELNQAIVKEPGRVDLRDLDIITIDGEDAKDLDDGVSARQLPNGNIELGVHIADVSHYVQSGTALDKEAYKRGTSVYLVDRVVPMLPPILSNNLCSLQAKQDRYAVSCIMEINEEGKVLRYQVAPSLIHVRRRCTYHSIYKAIAEDVVPDDLAPLMPMVHLLNKVAGWLNSMRRRRGALDFDFPEYKVILDEAGQPVRIVKKERTMAERLIEECMLIANETVATHLKKTGNPSIYRIHEQPKTEKIEALKEVLEHLGEPLRIPEGPIEPKLLQGMLFDLEGKDFKRIAEILTLRSLQQAKYSAENVGHFGLASTCYTHFTSPIRRYPDLMVHRLLKKSISWGDDYTKRDGEESYLVTAANHCSDREQNAVVAERSSVDLKKVQYMKQFMGEKFTGQISSITNFGFFVELENGVDGLVHLSTLPNDYFVFDEKHYVLVGQRTGTEYHLGQSIEVTLVKADEGTRQIDFFVGEYKPFAQFKPMDKASRWGTKKHSKKRGKTKEKSHGKKR